MTVAVEDLAAILGEEFAQARSPDARAHRRSWAQLIKRGGGVPTISLDTETAESPVGGEPADQLTPEQVFELQWAWTVLERSLERLRQAALSSQRLSVLSTLVPVRVPRESLFLC